MCYFSDDGHVVGVNCEEEDKIRREYIDQSIRAIKPPVDNKDYNVEFIPVEVNGKLRGHFTKVFFCVYKKGDGV